MGMCMGLCALGDDDIARLLRDPPLVWTVLAPDEPDVYLEASGLRRSWWSRLLGLRGGASALPAPIGAPLAEADIDKAWHGIHYLLTGSAWGGEPPLDFLVNGGVAVGDVDVGYGPARVIPSTGVQAIHAALSTLGAGDLRARFDREAMGRLEIYPDIWAGDEGEDGAINYCLHHFATLQDFISEAAARRMGILIHTC